MRGLTLAEFLKEVAESEGLRMKLARFAAEQGFDLGELGEEDFRAVTGAGQGHLVVPVSPDAAQVRPVGWFRTRAAERRSGEERRSGVVPVPVDRRKRRRRGRLVRTRRTR